MASFSGLGSCGTLLPPWAAAQFSDSPENTNLTIISGCFSWIPWQHHGLLCYMSWSAQNTLFFPNFEFPYMLNISAVTEHFYSLHNFWPTTFHFSIPVPTPVLSVLFFFSLPTSQEAPISMYLQGAFVIHWRYVWHISQFSLQCVFSRFCSLWFYYSLTLWQ